MSLIVICNMIIFSGTTCDYLKRESFKRFGHVQRRDIIGKEDRKLDLERFKKLELVPLYFYKCQVSPSDLKSHLGGSH